MRIAPSVICLLRWFPKEAVEVPEASHLDVILYSREQIVKESQSLTHGEPYEIPDIPWGVISVKGQMEVDAPVALLYNGCRTRKPRCSRSR